MLPFLGAPLINENPIHDPKLNVCALTIPVGYFCTVYVPCVAPFSEELALPMNMHAGTLNIRFLTILPVLCFNNYGYSLLN